MARITGAQIRDTIQWGIGAAIAVNETLIRHGEPRLIVLAFAGIFMGIPAVIGLLHLPGAPGTPKTPTGQESQSSSRSP